MAEEASNIDEERTVTADVEELCAAIDRIPLRNGGKRHAFTLGRALVGRVADLERRCREAEAGIAVTHAIRAALQA